MGRHQHYHGVWGESVELLSGCRLAETPEGKLCTLTAAQCVATMLLWAYTPQAQNHCAHHKACCMQLLKPFCCAGAPWRLCLALGGLQRCLCPGASWRPQISSCLHLLPTACRGPHDVARRLPPHRFATTVDASSFPGSGLDDQKDAGYADRPIASILLCIKPVSLVT